MPEVGGGRYGKREFKRKSPVGGVNRGEKAKVSIWSNRKFIGRKAFGGALCSSNSWFTGKTGTLGPGILPGGEHLLSGTNVNKNLKDPKISQLKVTLGRNLIGRIRRC